MDKLQAAVELRDALNALQVEVSEANADRVVAALDALAAAKPAPAPADGEPAS